MDSDGFTTSEVEVGKPEIRMVLLGKTGVGKSSSGNTILRRNAFKANPSSTRENQMEREKFEGQTLAVVDTPGLLNTRLTEMDVKDAVAHTICYVDPGPHVFLVVIHAGRFTEEEQQTVRIFQEMFGKEAAGYTMALFTYGDDLDADGITIEEFISGNSALFEFISQCGGGYHVFNNREKDPSQVRELLKKIKKKVSDNQGTYYTAEMFQEANRDKTQNPSSDVFPVIEADAVEAGKEEIRMVLLGKTGVGKSSSGDTILGRKAFKLNLSGTTKCQKETGKFDGQTLAVVDTPGLLHRRLTEEQVKSEIIRCISFAAPGPHVFLVVLQGGRFIEGDEKIVKIIQEMFGEEAAHYTMVLFTCGDDLEADGDTIVEIMIKDKKLCEFIRQCNVRYHVFENRKQDPSQVRELLEKINKMIRDNGGTYYKSEMFTQTERAIREKMRRLQRENPGMAEDEARAKAQQEISFSSYFQSSRTAVKEKASECLTQ